MKKNETKHVRGEFKRKSSGYIEKLGVTDASKVLKTRQEMCDVGKNLGGIYRICKGCGKEDETTEHVVECREVKD